MIDTPDSELKAFSVLPDVIAEQAAEAAAQGTASEGALLLEDTGEKVRYLVYPDGAVTVLTEGWHPVMEDGVVYTFARIAHA